MERVRVNNRFLTFRRGFSTTSPRKGIDGSAVIAAASDILVAAGVSASPGAPFNAILLTSNIAIGLSSAVSGILSAGLIVMEIFPDVFDSVDSVATLGIASLSGPDEIPESFTPEVRDDLSATAAQLDDLALTIGGQFYEYLTPAFRELGNLYENAASDLNARLTSGNLYLNPAEHMAIVGLENNLPMHHENLRVLGRTLYGLIDRTEPWSRFWVNHPELHTSFDRVHYIAQASVYVLNNFFSRSMNLLRVVRHYRAEHERRRRRLRRDYRYRR